MFYIPKHLHGAPLHAFLQSTSWLSTHVYSNTWVISGLFEGNFGGVRLLSGILISGTPRLPERGHQCIAAHDSVPARGNDCEISLLIWSLRNYSYSLNLSQLSQNHSELRMERALDSEITRRFQNSRSCCCPLLYPHQAAT